MLSSLFPDFHQNEYLSFSRRGDSAIIKANIGSRPSWWRVFAPKKSPKEIFEWNISESIFDATTHIYKRSCPSVSCYFRRTIIVASSHLYKRVCPSVRMSVSIMKTAENGNLSLDHLRDASYYAPGLVKLPNDIIINDTMSRYPNGFHPQWSGGVGGAATLWQRHGGSRSRWRSPTIRQPHQQDSQSRSRRRKRQSCCCFRCWGGGGIGVKGRVDEKEMRAWWWRCWCGRDSQKRRLVKRVFEGMNSIFDGEMASCWEVELSPSQCGMGGRWAMDFSHDEKRNVVNKVQKLISCHRFMVPKLWFRRWFILLLLFVELWKITFLVSRVVGFLYFSFLVIYLW